MNQFSQTTLQKITGPPIEGKLSFGSNALKISGEFAFPSHLRVISNLVKVRTVVDNIFMELVQFLKKYWCI